MKWDELTDKDKVKLILQHVIPHEIDDDIVFEKGHVEVKRRWTKDKPRKTIEWPVAAWDGLTAGEEDGCWMTRDIWSNWDTAFDPLHDMNDAWQIVEKLYERFDVRLFMEEDNTEKYYVQIWMKDGTDRMIGYGSSNDSVQEAIIEAALRSVGVKIE